MCLEPDSLSSALACPLDLGARPTCRGLMLLLSLAALGELLRDIVGGGCCQGLEVAGSRSRGLESTEEGGPKGPDSSGRIRQEDLGSSHRPAPYCMHVGLVTKSCLTCNPMDRSLPYLKEQKTQAEKT